MLILCPLQTSYIRVSDTWNRLCSSSIEGGADLTDPPQPIQFQSIGFWLGIAVYAYNISYSTPTIPATQEVEIGKSQSDASLGKKLETL
jgi:hypothetical protein